MTESVNVSGGASRVLSFPTGFTWGSATSAYQIEGAATEGGRVPSIWDTFCATAGTIADGSSGAVACDHYNRYVEDVALISDLHLDTYRFSLSWSRIITDAQGSLNHEGLDFYDRLVDALLDNGIRPYPTLYHWDLPQYLEDENGWVNRDTAHRFADYTEAVIDRLGDRVDMWTTLNEPFVSADHGYVTGEHAPGRTSRADGFAASHHLLLAHGLAAHRIRELAPNARLGIALNFTPTSPAGTSLADHEKALYADQLENYWYADPIAGYGYPTETAAHYGWDGNEVADGDLEIISQPIDVLGVNYYSRQIVSAEPMPERDVPRNTMGWEIHAPSFGELLRSLETRYQFPSLLITENGCPMPDDIRDQTQIVDNDRIDFIREHLREVHEAIVDGIPVEGYLVWSLFDNFEWRWGYGPTFGIVEIDRTTRNRIPKRSAHWLKDVATNNGFTLNGGPT